MYKKNRFHANKFKDENGNVWDSKKEYYRYEELIEECESGETRNLSLQEKFEILPKHKCLLDTKSEKAMYYTCDFVYIINDTLFIEDVKSEFTRKDRDYIMRRKLFKYFYLNIEDKEFKKLHERFPDLDFKNAVFSEVVM